jgi:hypothetical protein
MITVNHSETGIVVGQGYGEHFIEIPESEIASTMEKMAQKLIEIKEGYKKE